MTKPHPAHSKSRGSDRASPKRGPVTRRTWMFRLLALFLVPVCLLGAVELILSVAGYGYPISYFIRSRIAGKEYLIPNYKFSYRFFPQSLARVPALSRTPAEKAQDVYRIFVFGESAALGDPDPNYGVSRYLDVLLEERYPNTYFEVVCVAMTAINSHAILPIARECTLLEGDLWVIYMGNNEMVGPFGAGTIFGARAPSMGLLRSNLALKKTRTGQLLSTILSRLHSTARTPDQWSGINMFKENLLRYDDPARHRAYRNFEHNLKDILEAGRQAGVPIILSTVGSNLKDCAPFKSLHREDLEAAKQAEWERHFRKGIGLEEAGRHEEALSAYSAAAEIDSEFAELRFRMGTCLLALGRSEKAFQAFVDARDYDALAVRADTRINRILMDRTSGSNDRVQRIDAEKVLAAHSPTGIPGEELFYEHVHFTVEGNYLLGRMIADRVNTVLPPAIMESQTDQWMEQEACNRRLALTVWDQLRLWNEEAKRINTPPFTGQISNTDNKKHIYEMRASLLARVTTDTPVQDRRLYESALDRNPEDTMLIGNYAQFLDGNGMPAEAIEQAEQFCALLPDLAWPHYYLAALHAKAGRFRDAQSALQQALDIRNDFTQAREMLKQIERIR